MDTAAVRFGASYNGWGDPDPGDFAATTEELGFDSVWTGEHITNWRPGLTAIPVLGAFAARTRRVQIGSMLILPLRNPTIIAKELATLDIISRGRLAVGVGIGGENPAEFAACGVSTRERGGRTDEMLEILPRLWREPSVTHRGKYFALDEVSLDPRPASGGPQIYIIGRSEAAMRRAARFGNGFMPIFYTPEQCADALRRIHAYADALGRDLATFDLALTVNFSFADTRQAALQKAAAYLGTNYQQDFTALADKYCLLGPPADCIARLRDYVDAGVRRFVLGIAGLPSEAWREQFTVMAREVLPAFAGG